MNQRKIKLFIAVTLDGYIARPDGSLDWLDALENPTKSDYGYNGFYNSLDTVILGRKTYNEVLGFGVEWPYSACETIVVSRDEQLKIATEKTRRMGAEIFEQLPEWQQQPGKDIWLCGGGELITSFLDKGLVDEMILSLIPVILGDGLPLFPGKPLETQFELLDSTAFDNKVVNLHYRKV